MIQRIQTIYLFLCFLLTAGLLTGSFAELLSSKGEVYTFNQFSISSEFSSDTVFMSTWPVAALVIAISGIFLISIFLFKKRVLQARLCILNILLLTGLGALIFLYSRLAVTELDAKITYSFMNIVIPVAIILSYISNKKIRLDEALVKSYDRIR